MGISLETTSQKKEKNVLRISFQNKGGFPIDRGKHKEGIIRKGITKWEFDVFGFVETNVDWQLVPEENKLFFCTKEWWESLHLSWMHNSTQKPVTARQFGGTALFGIGPAAHRVAEKGADTTNLGRWSWTRYRGKNNQTLRIISAYRPNQPNGPFTVYAQQNAYLNFTGSPHCLRKAFLHDLCKDINNFLESGDNIIHMLDGNSNMQQSDLKSALESCTLREVILKKHGLNGPATFRRNNTKTPIDGIWPFPSVEIKAGDYFNNDSVFMNTNHHNLWVDISFINAFGHSMPAIVRPAARHLHCNDPCVLANYVKVYKEFINKNNLLATVKKLKGSVSHPMLEEQKWTFEDLYSLQCRGIQHAEMKCRKFRKGQVAYSPQLQIVSRRIEVWSLLQKKDHMTTNKL